MQPDGSVEEVPVISGNSLRGILRDRGMLHMCKMLGYGVDEGTGELSGLTLAAFYVLFSGGQLSASGKSLDIDKARRLRQLIPLLGVFGGALGNMIMPGKLKMGKAIPICAETAHLLPEKVQPAKPESIWGYLQEEMYTRKDDEKNEHLRQMIAPATRGFLDGATPKLAKTEAQNEQHQQMMYYVETFAAGTRFYWQIALDDVTDIEFEAFLTALVQFSRLPYIGGKSNVGLGEVAVNFDKWIQVDSRMSVQGTEISAPIGTAYQKHLEQNGAEIRQTLTMIQ